MKKVKVKIMGISMSLALLFGMSVPVMAAEQEETISCNAVIMEVSEEYEQLEQMPLPNVVGESIVI